MPILRRALDDRSRQLIWWTIGVLVYCGFILAVWPVIDGNEDFDAIFEELPDSITAMFGGNNVADFSSPVGFLSTYLFSMILPFIYTALAIGWGASLIAGEEEDGTLDLVLSYPVERRRLVLEKLVAIPLAVGSVGLATVLLLTVGRELVGLDVGVGGLASATLGSALFAVLYGAIALCIGALTGRKAVASGVAWGAALAGYLANVVANIDQSLDWLEPASPLYWATKDSPLEGTVPDTYVALLALFVVAGAAAVVAFDRHDLR